MIPSCEGLSCALVRCSACQQPLPIARSSSIPSSYANVLEGESHSPALPYFRTTVLQNLHYHSTGKLHAYSDRPVMPVNAKTSGLYKLAHKKERGAKFLSAAEGKQFI